VNTRNPDVPMFKSRTARNFLLRLSLSKGQRHSFENLAREDLDALKKAIETVTNGNVHLDVKDVSLKGWNWGKADVQGELQTHLLTRAPMLMMLSYSANDLAFLVQQRVAFEVPLAAISNSNMAGKNEVALEFSPPSAPERSNRPPDELMEMRFYIPQRTGKKRSGSKEDGEASDEDADDEGEEEEEDYDEEGNPISAAEAFHNAITTRAEIKEQAGDAIVTLPDVSVPTPRGRYDIELHADHLRLHGKTYDYKIPYKHIHRMFLLPKPDATFQQLIVSCAL
jgi:structure-specific recognition protein 1